MNEARPLQRERARTLLFILVWVAVVLMVVLVGSVFLFMHYGQNRTHITAAPAAGNVAQNLSEGTTQFSTSNQASVLLGQEKPEEDGVQHLADAGRGHTLIQILDGVPCRYLNRVTEGRYCGSLYFAINPSFKREGLKNARVEIEYFAKPDVSLRLQFDGMDGDTHRMYLPVLPEGARVMRFGTGADYATIPTPGVWSSATFHITNAVFTNSQRDGADFRLEVVPPEIYVRRVTVTRESP